MQIGKDYIGVSAGAVITNHAGKYFLAKRSAKARDDQGAWEFPGGTIALYESREQAALRNIREKYGMRIKVLDTLGIYDVIDRKHGKDHWISTTYLCEHLSGASEIMDPQKCEQIGWFTFAELQRLQLSRITHLNVLTLANRDKV